MAFRYSIHPSIGIARVGNSGFSGSGKNSLGEFYLEPEEIGGLPIECDQQGNSLNRAVTQFKDDEGKIKRQAARFRIFKFDDEKPGDPGMEVTVRDKDVKSIEWTAHIANKKGAWWNFAELQGNLMLGDWEQIKVRGRNVWRNTNSYESCMARHSDSTVSMRNSSVTDEAARQKLIIDPGPRSVRGPSQKPVEFSRDNIPKNYPHGSFPDASAVTQGWPINTLGAILTDDAGRLLVLGGYGLSGGNQPITSYAGADSWNDDISDGPVYCTLTLKNGDVLKLDAWVTVGSPKYAPELVNIVTLDDIMFDVGVRFFDLVPAMYDGKKQTWNKNYTANYKRDIEPIIRRPMDSMWVSNVPSMAPFFAPPFNPQDNSESNRENREIYFSYFRRPGEPHNPSEGEEPPHGYNTLWSGNGDPATNIPMMPLQSGSNSVWNYVIEKFLTLTDTQYFLLGQWAAGKFSMGDESGPIPPSKVHPLDYASIGNCVGGPMCPGIEVTWSTHNPPIYSEPYRILHRYAEEHYQQFGLSTTHDECTPARYLPKGEAPGCEPGDLTKRMAIPWQADFFQCTAQWVNYAPPGNVNKDPNHIPLPPAYFAYWWPPQSPLYVLSGVTTTEEQQIAGVPAGFQVYYPRGINSFTQMIQYWWTMGFILNQNTDKNRKSYPYFVEKERNHKMYRVASVVVGGVSNVINPQDAIFWQMWYLKDEDEALPVEIKKKDTREHLAENLSGSRGRIRPRSFGNQRTSEDLRRKRD
jgi:L-Lysine epsilon oxidase N-terminal/L-lysine epsilon oxidase C-terminal domain